MTSDTNITPSVWGPSTWRAIHFIALGYPENPTEESIQFYGNFFEDALPKVLPCKTCANNYIRHLQELPITPYLYSGGKNRLFEWTVELHNLVNKEIGKVGPAWTPERALAALVSGAQTTSSQSSTSPPDVVTYPKPTHTQTRYSGNSTTNLVIGSIVVIALILIAALLIRMHKARST